MADSSYVKSLVGGLAKDVKLALEQAFTYVLANLTIGAYDPDRRRASNFQWYWCAGTTSSNANIEFSIAHGLGKVPSVLLQALPLNQVNAQIVPLRVSRAADANRVYLTSSSTGAAIFVLVE